ncbi:MAG: hypothetical protein OXU36_18915 [Candidatus Poribacteria bacterium]|nr:hypothetical protein [Candidatus Poribacteria bacterium]
MPQIVEQAYLQMLQSVYNTTAGDTNHTIECVNRLPIPSDLLTDLV